jgi:hypothetical protein
MFYKTNRYSSVKHSHATLFRNVYMFLSKKTITRPPLQVLYNKIQFSANCDSCMESHIVYKIYIKLYKNLWVSNNLV